jgi:hypothetical protein
MFRKILTGQKKNQKQQFCLPNDLLRYSTLQSLKFIILSYLLALNILTATNIENPELQIQYSELILHQSVHSHRVITNSEKLGMNVKYWIQRLRMHPRMRHQATTNTLAPSTCNRWWKEWDGDMGAGEAMARFSEGRSGLMGRSSLYCTLAVQC